MAKKARARTLDMSKAESKGGRFAGKVRHYPDGDYEGLIVSVEEEESDAGNDMWVYAIKVKSGLFPLHCVLNSANLWKVRNLFESAGLKVPSSKAKLDPNEPLGEKVAVSLEAEEYEGKWRSKIQAVFPLDELVEDDDEDRPKKSKKSEKKKAKRAVDEDEEEDEEEEDEEEEEPPKKKKAKRAAEEEEEDEEDEDEEEERPRKKAKKKKKDDDEEDLEEIDVEDV